MPANRASFGYCHSILIILGLTTISIMVIVNAFSLALINENHQILQDTTFTHFDTVAHAEKKAIRVARCDVGVCTFMTTVTKTVYETSKVPGQTTRIMIAWASESPVNVGGLRVNVEGGQEVTRTRLVVPTGAYVVNDELIVSKAVGGGSKRREMVHFNKPEMQM